MNAIQLLEDALQERNKKTNEFLETIIAIINDSVTKLPFCTRENSTPEVAGSVKVLKKDLDEIIAKIKDNKNIDQHAAEGLVTRLKFSNVKAVPSSTNSWFSDGSVPRLSELDRSSSDSRLSDRSSYASARGSMGGRTRTRRR